MTVWTRSGSTISSDIFWIELFGAEWSSWFEIGRLLMRLDVTSGSRGRLKPTKGSTGGSSCVGSEEGEGFAEAISTAAARPANSNPFWPDEVVAGCPEPNSSDGPSSPSPGYPGVLLMKREYSLAKPGVQPAVSSAWFLLALGVCRRGLKELLEVGVRVGVGG